MPSRHLSTTYIVLLTVLATLVVLLGIGLLTGVIVVQMPQRGGADARPAYEEWYRRDGRAAIIYTISPVAARLMSCTDAADPVACTCKVQMRNYTDLLAEAGQYASQAPVGYAATHSALEDGLAQYEGLRRSVQDFCRQPNEADYQGIRTAVLHYADVRNVLMSKLQKQP